MHVSLMTSPMASTLSTPSSDATSIVAPVIGSQYELYARSMLVICLFLPMVGKQVQMIMLIESFLSR